MIRVPALIRVVVTGSECTGKTTLAVSLARELGVPWSGEFVRELVDRKGAPPEAGDVDAIARGQIAAEDEAIAAASHLVVHDTDLLSTVIYAEHYYGHCPEWIGRALGERPADLYLLAGLDVPWVPDGSQRDRPADRDAMQGLFRKALDDRGSPFVEVVGSPSERLRASLLVISTGGERSEP